MTQPTTRAINPKSMALVAIRFKFVIYSTSLLVQPTQLISIIVYMMLSTGYGFVRALARLDHDNLGAARSRQWIAGRKGLSPFLSGAMRSLRNKAIDTAYDRAILMSRCVHCGSSIANY